MSGKEYTGVSRKKTGRDRPDWFYCQPDDRNRLIEEARELIAAAQVTFKKVGVKTKDCPTWFKAANAFMKETRP